MKRGGSPVSIMYHGPETSTWAGLLIKLCRENDLLSLVQCHSRESAEINISACTRSTCMMVHESRIQEFHELSKAVSIKRPVFYLAEPGSSVQRGRDESWFETDYPLKDVACTVIAAMLRYLECNSPDPVEAREVVGRASHDLKSPLAAILAYCQLGLSEEKTNTKLRTYFTRIEANVKKADELIVRHMTDFTASRGKLKVAPVPTNLVSWLSEELCHEIEVIAKKGLRFETSIQQPMPEGIMLDRLLVGQIMKNLLENASKNTDKGLVKVSAAYLQPARKLRLDVTDSGKGISSEVSRSVFHMFSESRGPDLWQQKYRSIGIGLNNARRLAQLMGGDVTLLESSPGKGSTFRVELTGVETALNVAGS